MVLLFLDLHCFWWEVSCDSVITLCIVFWEFGTLLLIFFPYLWFSAVCDESKCGFHCIYLAWMSTIPKCPESAGSGFSSICESFWQMFFLSHFLFLPWLPLHICYAAWYSPTDHWGKFFFPTCFRLDDFWSLPILSFVASDLLFMPSNKFLFLIIVFFSLWFPFGSFL